MMDNQDDKVSRVLRVLWVPSDLLVNLPREENRELLVFLEN